jgi:predicted nucleic acid-binding protein
MVHLVGSSVLVALFLVHDTHHAEAARFFDRSGAARVLVPYAVVRETATVLAYRGSKAIADTFLTYLTQASNVTLFRDDDMEGEMAAFLGISTKISFTDCALLHYARAGHSVLVTYDKQLARLARRAVS